MLTVMDKTLARNNLVFCQRSQPLGQLFSASPRQTVLVFGGDSVEPCLTRAMCIGQSIFSTTHLVGLGL